MPAIVIAAAPARHGEQQNPAGHREQVARREHAFDRHRDTIIGTTGCPPSACTSRNAKERVVAGRGDERRRGAARPAEPASAEQPRRERQQLHAWMPTKCGTRRSPCSRLQPVSGSPGPPSGAPTVWAPDTFSPVERATSSCAGVGVGHQPAGRLAEHGQQHAEPQRPAERGVGEPLPEQRDGQRDRRAEQHDDGRCPSMLNSGRVERRRRVEVAGEAASRLQVDDPDLEHQDDGGDPADDRRQPPPLREEGEDPGERERVDRRRDRELRRLQPGRRAEDRGAVDRHRRQRRGEGHQHHRADRGQRRARLPETLQCCHSQHTIRLQC